MMQKRSIQIIRGIVSVTDHWVVKVQPVHEGPFYVTIGFRDPRRPTKVKSLRLSNYNFMESSDIREVYEEVLGVIESETQVLINRLNRFYKNPALLKDEFFLEAKNIIMSRFEHGPIEIAVHGKPFEPMILSKAKDPFEAIDLTKRLLKEELRMKVQSSAFQKPFFKLL